MNKFAPKIRNKTTGEVSNVGLIRFGQEVTIYHASDGYSYKNSEGLIGTDNWRDIADIELLIPTGFYDDNEEMIYVASFEELHDLLRKDGL